MDESARERELLLHAARQPVGQPRAAAAVAFGPGISRRGFNIFAFGLPATTVLRMAVTESTVVGMLGTSTGVLFGWLLLGEVVPPLRWIGAILISVGVVLIGMTPARTTGQASHREKGPSAPGEARPPQTAS